MSAIACVWRPSPAARQLVTSPWANQKDEPGGTAPGSAGGVGTQAFRFIFAGDTLIGFYLRNDYKDITRSSGSPDGGETFAWDKGEASLSRSPSGGAVLVVHERGKPDLPIPLKREGG